MIKVKNLGKYYRVQGRKKVVFENLNLELPLGGRLALIGPNGAGKSTLLRILSGVEKPSQGQVIRTSTISWPVGVSSGFLPMLTAEENVRFVCRLFECNKAEMREKLDFVQDFSEIGDHFKMPLTTYSSGMRARVAFGLSMAFDFDYYIIDETLAVGDNRFKDKCRNVLGERVKGRGIILVSHSMSVIREFCDQGIFLSPEDFTYEKNINSLINKYKSYCKLGGQRGVN